MLLGNHVVGFENVDGDIDEVLSQPVSTAGSSMRWVGEDGLVARLAAVNEE